MDHDGSPTDPTEVCRREGVYTVCTLCITRCKDGARMVHIHIRHIRVLWLWDNFTWQEESPVEMLQLRQGNAKLTSSDFELGRLS